MAVQFGVSVLARAGLSVWLMPEACREEKKKLLLFHVVDMVVSSLLSTLIFKEPPKGKWIHLQVAVELVLVRLLSASASASVTKFFTKPIALYEAIVMGLGSTDVVLLTGYLGSRFSKRAISFPRIWY